MTILDRYVLRRFLINWAILLAVIFLLVAMIDVIIDLDEFFKASRLMADRYGGRLTAMLVVMADFYGPLFLLLYVFFSGLLGVGAMAFAVSGLRKNRELVAMAAGGVSLYRVAMPMLAAGFVLNLAILPIQEYLIPRFAAKLVRSKSEMTRQTLSSFTIRFAADGRGNLFTADEFDAEHQRFENVMVLQRSPDARAVRRVRGEQAFWVPEGSVGTDSGQAGPGWELPVASVLERSIDQPAADPSRAAVDQVVFVPSDLSPDVIVAREASFSPRFWSIAKLRAMQRNPVVAADPRMMRAFERIQHTRVSMFLFSWLLMMVCLPLFLSREAASSLQKVAGVAVLLSLGLWAAGLVLMETTALNLGPITAAWLPVVLLLPGAVVMMMRVRT